MLLSGVIMRTICHTNFQYALTSMIDTPQSSSVQHFTSRCNTSNATCTTNNMSTNQTYISQITKPLKWVNETDTVLGANYWFAGVARLIGGFLCQKYGAKIVFGYSNFALALLNQLIPLMADNFVALLIIRSMQGFCNGLGGMQICGIMCSKWIPRDERSKFMTVTTGINVGTAASFLLASWIISLFNWQMTFTIGSCGTLAWCVLWYILVSDTPQQHPRISVEERDHIVSRIGDTVSREKLPIPWKSILCSKAVFLTTFCNWVMVLAGVTCVLYLPLLFEDVFHLGNYQTGIYSSVPFALHAAYAIAYGAFVDILIRRSALRVIHARKISALISFILTGALFASVIFFGNHHKNVVIFIIALVVITSGSGYSATMATLVDISPNFCSILFGITGLITTSGGFIATIIVDYVVNGDYTEENWGKVFFVIGVLLMVSGTMFMLFGTVTIQPWNYVDGASSQKKSDTEPIEETKL